MEAKQFLKYLNKFEINDKVVSVYPSDHRYFIIKKVIEMNSIGCRYVVELTHGADVTALQNDIDEYNLLEKQTVYAERWLRKMSKYPKYLKNE